MFLQTQVPWSIMVYFRVLWVPIFTENWANVVIYRQVPAKLVEKRLKQTVDAATGGNSRDEQMDVDGDGQKDEGTNGKNKDGESDTDDERVKMWTMC